MVGACLFEYNHKTGLFLVRSTLEEKNIPGKTSFLCERECQENALLHNYSIHLDSVDVFTCTGEGTRHYRINVLLPQTFKANH